MDQGGKGKPSEASFRFFDLPSELRNIIYGQLTLGPRWTTTSPVGKGGRIGQVFTKGFCVGEALRVSRRFRQECVQEVLRSAEFTVIVPVGGIGLPYVFWVLASMLLGYTEKIQHVTVCLHNAWPTSFRSTLVGVAVERWSSALEVLQMEVTDLLPSMKALRTVNLRLEGKFDSLVYCIDKGLFDPHQFFAADLMPQGATETASEQSVCITKSLLLETGLYDAYELPHGTGWSRGVADRLQYDQANRIIYRGSPTMDGLGGYRGLDLETWSTGIFDYERVVAEYEEVYGDSEES